MAASSRARPATAAAWCSNGWQRSSWLSEPSAEAQTLVTLLAAAATAQDDHLLFLPYVAGERAPFWNADASGSIIGLRLEHTAAHVLRAAVEGILFNARWMSERLFELLGRPNELIATGKVLEVDWIRQLTADIFGLPVRFPGGADASATGAATLANIATRQWTWDDAVQRQSGRSAAMIHPSAASSDYLATITPIGSWPVCYYGRPSLIRHPMRMIIRELRGVGGRG